MTTIAVLPVKRFTLAKQRLAEGLDPDARRSLAASMVSDVLDALARIDGLDAVVVVSSDAGVLDLAAAAGAETVVDRFEDGQSAAAEQGLLQPSVAAADRALLVAGDTPGMDPRDVTTLLRTAPAAPSVVVVPDRHGTGTNALLLSPPEVIAPAFGPLSCARHVDLAAAAGVTSMVTPVPSLGFDVDTPEDLAALRRDLDDRPEAAPHTRAALAQLAAVTAP
jgi:2-phospho-L-lactate guanylyltransferase